MKGVVGGREKRSSTCNEYCVVCRLNLEVNKPQSRPAICLLIKYVLKQLSVAETDEYDDAWAVCALTGVKNRSRNLYICVFLFCVILVNYSHARPRTRSPSLGWGNFYTI